MFYKIKIRLKRKMWNWNLEAGHLDAEQRERDEKRLLDSEAVWLCCPVCKRKTKIKITKDTVLLHFPLYCPNCKQESMINVVQLKMTVEWWQNKKTCFFDWKRGRFSLSRYLWGAGWLARSTVRTVSIIWMRAAASCSVQVSSKW